MEQIIYIYNEKLKLIGEPFVKDIEEFWKEPTIYFPSWKAGYYATLEKYGNPIIDNISGNIREKTREELILLNNQIELLQDGEYVEAGEIIIVEAPEGFIEKIWDKEAHIWKEKATLEEQRIVYKNKIDGYKAEILEKGFVFERHNQKCRDKDLALLSSAIAALEDKGGTEGLLWAFSDTDTIKLSLSQLKQMRIAGMNFITTVYGVEAYLKQGEIISDLTVEKFREKVNENSEAKAV